MSRVRWRMLIALVVLPVAGAFLTGLASATPDAPPPAKPSEPKLPTPGEQAQRQAEAFEKRIAATRARIEGLQELRTKHRADLNEMGRKWRTAEDESADKTPNVDRELAHEELRRIAAREAQLRFSLEDVANDAEAKSDAAVKALEKRHALAKEQLAQVRTRVLQGESDRESAMRRAKVFEIQTEREAEAIKDIDRKLDLAEAELRDILNDRSRTQSGNPLPPDAQILLIADRELTRRIMLLELEVQHLRDDVNKKAKP